MDNQTTLSQLADELAFLSNECLVKLAEILVRDYPSRADILETQLNAQFREHQPLVSFHYE